MNRLLYDIEIPSKEDGLYEELTLEKGYVWTIFPKSTKHQLMAFEKENLGNVAPQRGPSLNFDLLQAKEDVTIRLQSNAKKGTTATAYYSKTFFFRVIGRSVGNGGGQQITLSFQNPLKLDGELVSLLTSEDFGVDDEQGLILNLPANADFQKLEKKINSLLGVTIKFVGQINNTEAEVVLNPQLLTDFVQGKLSRQPLSGDLVRTSDDYIFIFNGDDWVSFGQSVIGIATTETAGLMKFGSEDGDVYDAGEGKASVKGYKELKTAVSKKVNVSGDEVISGVKSFTEPLVLEGFQLNRGSLILKGEENQNIFLSFSTNPSEDPYASVGFTSGSNVFHFNNEKEDGIFEFQKKIRGSAYFEGKEDNDFLQKRDISDVVFTNKTQTISSETTFSNFLTLSLNAQGKGSLVLLGSGDRYISWMEGSDLKAYIGFPSKSHNRFEFNTNRTNSYFVFNKKIEYSSKITPTGDNELVPKWWVLEQINAIRSALGLEILQAMPSLEDENNAIIL